MKKVKEYIKRMRERLNKVKEYIKRHPEKFIRYWPLGLGWEGLGFGSRELGFKDADPFFIEWFMKADKIEPLFVSDFIREHPERFGHGAELPDEAYEFLMEHPLKHTPIHRRYFTLMDRTERRRNVIE